MLMCPSLRLLANRSTLALLQSTTFASISAYNSNTATSPWHGSLLLLTVGKRRTWRAGTVVLFVCRVSLQSRTNKLKRTVLSPNRWTWFLNVGRCPSHPSGHRLALVLVVISCYIGCGAGILRGGPCYRNRRVVITIDARQLSSILFLSSSVGSAYT
ncbi:hypothetical protein IW261DRAFT_1512509 [Armillaria novae-zelandiae]|uniref:Uncharacterized protein n=1 Tax=Armillaria novae-zelandiae TaxID=153914 RepID=A0AA39NT05_9AGAR|nr:hypothetical protein IW261DRAFT_1512509 [Armillaria novae-zelandiae]